MHATAFTGLGAVLEAEGTSYAATASARADGLAA